MKDYCTAKDRVYLKRNVSKHDKHEWFYSAIGLLAITYTMVAFVWLIEIARPEDSYYARGNTHAHVLKNNQGKERNT